MKTPFNLLTTTCTVNTPDFVVQADGMDKNTGDTPVASIPCRVERDSSQLGVEYMRAQGRVLGRIFLPDRYGGSAITVVKDGTITDASGTTWRVLGPGYHEGGLSGVIQTVQVELIS